MPHWTFTMKLSLVFASAGPIDEFFVGGSNELCKQQKHQAALPIQPLVPVMLELLIMMWPIRRSKYPSNEDTEMHLMILTWSWAKLGGWLFKIDFFLLELERARTTTSEGIANVKARRSCIFPKITSTAILCKSLRGNTATVWFSYLYFIRK